MKLQNAVPALAFSLLAASATAQVPESAPAPVTEPVTESVLVVGQRPGPGLWKVSQGEHVLYIFGKYGPLPKKMEWRSHEVEAILAKSQEFLPEPKFHASVGFWGGLKLAASIPHLLSIRDNPDGATLQEVVPAETYARWLTLKDKYLADETKTERYRPIFASAVLFSAGLEKTGLSTKDQVDGVMQKLLKQSKIKVTESRVEKALADAGSLIRDFKSTRLDDAACFAATLSQLESDIDQMRVRANAWAVGDIGKIRQLDFIDREGACRNAVESSAAFQSRPELAQMRTQAYALWLENAEKALASNASTFAVLRMSDILSPNGPVAALQAKGYKIESPE